MKKHIGIIGLLLVSTVCFSQTSQPTKQETFDWLRTKMLAYGENEYFDKNDHLDDERQQYAQLNDIVCDTATGIMTIVYNHSVHDESTSAECNVKTSMSINFSQLNASTIVWSGNTFIIQGKVHAVGRIVEKGCVGNYNVEITQFKFSFDDSKFKNEPDLKDRLSKALKTAITYCGGVSKEEKF